MQKKLSILALVALFSSLIFTSCKKDKTEENEEEVITTVELSFTPSGGGSTLTYSYDDPDGPGGAAPTQQEIVLAPNTTYAVSMKVLNKTVTPAEDITVEIEEEAEAHRFYYEPSAGSNILISGLDDDPNGIPLGITSSWTTSTAATGTVKVTLRHYPGTPPNKAIGDPVNSTKSSTDVEVTFVTRVN